MTGDTELGLLLHDPFPEPEPPTEPVAPAPRARSRIRRPRTLTTVIVVIVLIAAAGGIWAATGSSAATYRWTTVTKGDVNQTLDSYGTVTPIHQANVTFPVSGKVATVPVEVGQHVTAGQTLATLEVSSLQSKLDSAKAAYTTAEAKLVADQQAQATGSTVAATNTSATLSGADTGQATPLSTRPSAGGTGSSGRTGSSGSTGGSSSAQSAVTAAQAKLLADQHTVDTLTDAVAADLRLGTSTCASLIASLQNLAVTPQAPTPSASPTPAGGSGAPHVPDTSACTTLLNKILADQQAVTAAQATVSSDETALTTAVNKLVAAANSGGTTGSGGSTGGSTSGGRSSGGASSSGSSSGSALSGSGRTSGGGGGGGGGTTITAEQLVVDQSTVDADLANAIVAAEALNQATLVSPLAGTVAAVNVSPGSTAGTSSAAVTVIGPGADLVSTTVSDLDLNEIHVGSDASVTTDGNNTPLHGTVTAIGLLPVSTSSSSTSSSSSSRGSAASAASSSSSSSSSAGGSSSSATYPVTISLDAGGLYSGSGADVSIVVKKLTKVLTVPTSAVTSLGQLHTVTLQSGGKATRRVVVVGASDATFTQITSGLSQGQHVALAQMNLALPSSGSTNIARLAGGGGTGRTGFGPTGTAGAPRTGG